MITRWLAPVLAAFLIAGCGKKTESQAPSPATQPAAAVPTQQISAEMESTLAALTQDLRKYCFSKQRMPVSIEEVVAAGYMKDLPPPTAGKKFAIDSKKVQVVLVTQ